MQINIQFQLTLEAASIQALIEFVPTILTPGIAKPLSFAYSSKSFKAWPVTTPGLTLAGKESNFMFKLSPLNGERNPVGENALDALNNTIKQIKRKIILLQNEIYAIFFLIF